MLRKSDSNQGPKLDSSSRAPVCNDHFIIHVTMFFGLWHKLSPCKKVLLFLISQSRWIRAIYSLISGDVSLQSKFTPFAFASDNKCTTCRIAFR